MSQPSTALPERTVEAEEAFMEGLHALEPSDEALAELVDQALSARRVRLAARVVQLLSEDAEIAPGSALDRAQRAANLMLLEAPRPEDQSYSALDEAWAEARRERIKRIKRRWRNQLAGNHSRVGRLDRSRRR